VTTNIREIRGGAIEAYGVVYILAKPTIRSKNTQPNTIGITVSAAIIWFTRHSSIGLGLMTELSDPALHTIAQRRRGLQARLVHALH
jgi:hypothetical protein